MSTRWIHIPSICSRLSKDVSVLIEKFGSFSELPPLFGRTIGVKVNEKSFESIDVILAMIGLGQAGQAGQAHMGE